MLARPRGGHVSADAARDDDGTGHLVAGGIVTFVGLSAFANAGVFFLVGGIFAVVFSLVFGLPFDDWALDERAVTCAGHVTEVRPDPNYQVNGEDTAVVRYACEGLGDAWKVRVTASSALARLQPGDPVTVEYLPEDPRTSRVQGSRAAIAGWAGLGGLICAGLGLGALLVVGLVPLAGVLLLVKGIRRRRAKAG